jgi:hypothetical protein
MPLNRLCHLLLTIRRPELLAGIRFDCHFGLSNGRFLYVSKIQVGNKAPKWSSVILRQQNIPRINIAMNDFSITQALVS